MRHFSISFIIPIQTGCYLYVESSETTPDQRAELVSPWLLGRLVDGAWSFTTSCHVWQNNGKPVKLTLSDGGNWYIFYKKGDQDQYWKKGIGNIDPPTGLRYRVSIYRKFLLSVAVVMVVDLDHLELLSYFSRDKGKGDQIVLKLAKIEYRISSKKRPGAYFKFQPKGWTLIRRRAMY